MPNFEGMDAIILQPNDSAVPYDFRFYVCSGSTTNDGSVPFGLTVSSMEVTSHRQDGTVVTTGIISATSSTGDSTGGFVTTVYLGYPTSSGAQTGRYHLTFKATFSDGSIKEYDFNRLRVRNL